MDWLDELERRARIAMYHRQFREALFSINMAIQAMGNQIIPRYSAMFFQYRAECYWSLEHFGECLEDMHRVHALGLPPMSIIERKEAYDKWFLRCENLLDSNITVAAGFFDMCVTYSRTPKEHARCLVMQGLATYCFGNQQRGMEIIEDGHRIYWDILEETSSIYKSSGITAFRSKDYFKSKQHLQRALILTPTRSEHAETRRSICSHLSAVHFNLGEYQLALQRGRESYDMKPIPSAEESNRWKERGKRLFQEKKFHLLIEYYTLALRFAPQGLDHADLRSTLCSNRSIAYNKLGQYKEALSDAIECAQIKPDWSKAQYRLGTSLIGLERPREALDAFCKAFNRADESDKTNILQQILSAAVKLPDGIASAKLTVPKERIQELIRRCVANQDWEKLALLFMGGGGPDHHRFGEGGLATGCDASGVPLELVVQAAVRDTRHKFDMTRFVEELIKHDAPLVGSPGCTESPINVARRENHRELFEVLSMYDKTEGKVWKKKGQKALQAKDFQKAIYFLNIAVKCNLNSQEQLECYGLLSEAHYETKDYWSCIEMGRKVYDLEQLKSKEKAEMWKQRGNKLLPQGLYNVMTECYTLALNYVPLDCNHERASILSNRSMAYIKQDKIVDAKQDADLCILNRKTWFRGYSRLADCWAASNNYQDAVNEYCRGLRAVETDNEKFSLANDMVTMCAKPMAAGVVIMPIKIPVSIINKVIDGAAEQKNVDKLRYIFLEKKCQQTGSAHMRSLAHEATASRVPLEIFLQPQVDVKDKPELVKELLSHGASPNGGPKCTIPPIKLALEQKNFKMAAQLLHHGADPAPILGRNDMLDPHEMSPGNQWLRLARKANRNRDVRRAEMLFSLALEFPDIQKKPSARCEVFRCLSDISFELGDYKDSLAKGYQWFEISPTKSEDEADKWLERSHHIRNSGPHNAVTVPMYLTLALNYAPPSNKPLRFKLLCFRSSAYKAINDHQQAMVDGKDATAINPDDVEGYKCLVSCYKSLGRKSQTMSALNQCLRTETHMEKKREYLKEALEFAKALPEGTTSLTVEVPKVWLNQLQDEAIQSGDWEFVRLLYLGGGGPNRHQVDKGGFATGLLSAEQVAIEDVVSASFTKKPETLSALLEHDALVNGFRGNSNPLLSALTKSEKEVVKVLIDHGAMVDNEPLLHKAVYNAIDTGSFEMLQLLLGSSHPDIENTQDCNGNTLFHHAMKGKFTNNKCKVIKMLCNSNVNPTLTNKKGTRAIDCCNKNDDRNKMLKKTIKAYTEKKKKDSKLNKSKRDDDHHLLQEKEKKKEEKVIITAAEVTDALTSPAREETPQPQKLAKPIIQSKEEKKEDTRRYLEYLIERLVIEKADNLSHLQNMDEEITDQIDEEIEKDDEEEVLEIRNGINGESEDTNEEAAAIDDEKELTTHDNESLFENLSWEVDCTENVWKTLRSRKVGSIMRKRIIEKIRMLAQGRWNKALCKRLEGEPKKHKILLYEAKLTKSSRILWEKTVAFSGRCSNDPKLRLRASEQGRIYSDIIRVWDIVLDHGDLEHRIENVVKSHQRGSRCIIKANLKGIENSKLETRNNSEMSLTLPSYYQERTNRPGTHLPVERETDVFFPPASSEENEYHILKFYSFTSALISTLIDGDGKTRIDFPFKVTDLEHAIINLKPDPSCPIILLGRSGTGKTTCCLYRLWTEFQNYWENAIKAGPYMPRYVPVLETTQDSAQSSSAAEKLLPEPVLATDSDSSSEGNESELENQSEDDKPGIAVDHSSSDCEHLHQVFITKNTVLCSEVQKNFKDLSNACPATKCKIDDSIPNKIHDIGEMAWPLFIGSRDWLLLLDASLPEPAFFKRAADGSLLKQIEGWGEEDKHLHFIPEDDEETGEDFQEGQTVTQNDIGQAKSKTAQVKNLKREISYQVFRDEVWPKMKNSNKVDYHPTLVWTEIRSFIKGSSEAMKTECGYLSCEEYRELGRKRAPNFMGDRNTVYQLFEVYQNIRTSKGMFDEADFVFHLHRRLKKNPELTWSIHSIYVDETQDFTQAELSLLILCCRYQNRMFFTGDTAQSIMRGIAFRFEDLKSLFHAIKTFKGTKTSNEQVNIPDRLYQLTHNYRSHAGILRLASSVVNLLTYFFRDSFDKLDEDCGLFEGPRPVLLESCSSSDLAMILRGNKRHASRIEFGAHQAVLVVSEEARNNMPEELKHGLVLTIYEAKGLEFDDVLIYNFFKDSHAKKEWRVVISYIEEKQKESHRGLGTGLVEIQEKDLSFKTRPLEFHQDRHKVLNSEFKFLYTAITRARVNVWFFDEDEEARAPMFEYFRRLNLVEAVTLDQEGQGATETLSSMFAESSTKDEWKQQGNFFYNKHLWIVAEKCFAFAEDDLMVRKCRAQQQAQEALKHRGNPRMKEEFCIAAARFLECDMADEAEVCLHNAREKVLLAKLYKKMEKFEEASKWFRLERNYEEASECMESTNNYKQAIELLCESRQFQKAIEVLERYNSLRKIDGTLETQVNVPPKPNRTIERLCYKLAEEYLKDDKREEMEAVLQRLPSINDRISFLKKNGCIEEAARALVDNNRREEAAKLLQLHGRFAEAMKYYNDDKFLADCCLFGARAGSRLENQYVVQLLEDAIKYYRRCKDARGEGEALLLMGRERNNLDLITESGKLFDKVHDVCGQCEVAEEWLIHGVVTPFYYRITVRSIERLLDLIINLHKPYTQLKTVQHQAVTVCEQFFGLMRDEDTRIRRYWTKTHERFQQLVQSVPDSSGYVDIDAKKAYDDLSTCLIDKAITLVDKTTAFFESKLTDNSSFHENLFIDHYEVLFHKIYLNHVTTKFQRQLKTFTKSPILAKVNKLVSKDNEEYRSCKLFVKFIFPDAGSKVQQVSPEQIAKIRKHHAVRSRLMLFCDREWRSLGNDTHSTDVFLQVSQVMQLLDLHKLVLDYIRNKEDHIRKLLLKKNDKRLIPDNGMAFIYKDRLAFESFLRYWANGKKCLHIDGDVIESLHQTSRRFLTYTAKSRSASIYPSIANTLMILEHQMTVSLVMLARLYYRGRLSLLCVPESYLSRLHFIDDMNCSSRTHYSTFRAIENHERSFQYGVQTSAKQVHNLLSYIVRLMFGGISYEFNVFHDTFLSQGETEELSASGVPARTMILSLTLLINFGKLFFAENENFILQNVFWVIPRIHPSLPGYLKEAFLDMNKAKTYGDAVKILIRLLHERNAGEKLLDFRWNQMSSRFDTSVSNPDKYTLTFDDAFLSQLKAEVQTNNTESSRPVIPIPTHLDQEAEHEADENDEDRIMMYKLVEEKERERERQRQSAAVKIQKIFRRNRERRRKKDDIEEMTRSVPTLERLAQFKVDSSACMICGVTFTDSTERQHETFQDHVSDGSHENQKKQFEEYKELYVSCIEKLLERARQFKERDAGGLEMELDTQQLDEIKDQIWDQVLIIEKTRKWQDSMGLKAAAEKLGKKLEEIEKMVDQVQAEGTIGEGRGGSYSDVRDEDEDDPSTNLITLPGKQRKLSRNKSRKKKRKK